MDYHSRIYGAGVEYSIPITPPYSHEYHQPSEYLHYLPTREPYLRFPTPPITPPSASNRTTSVIMKVSQDHQITVVPTREEFVCQWEGCWK